MIVFDGASEREHFLREVWFSGSKFAFGFVVPVPSLPEVALVKEAPFDRLDKELGFERVENLGASRHEATPHLWQTPDGWVSNQGAGLGSGHGRLGGGGGEWVEVVAETQVGSGKATVLKASDAGSLLGWLKENKLETTPSSAKWIERYVTLGFHFVAFRYEAPKDDKKPMTAETVRISFATPQAYYPYREPDAGATATERLLYVWMIASSPLRPVAAHREETGQVVYKRPWEEGWRSEMTRAELKLPDEVMSMLPGGERVLVQTFRDQKTSRRGWSDTVMVPAEPVALDEEARAKRAGLVKLLLPEAP